MRARLGLLAVLVLAAGGTGCCRFARNWCDDDRCHRYRDPCCSPPPRDCGETDPERIPPQRLNARSGYDDPRSANDGPRPVGAYGGTDR